MLTLEEYINKINNDTSIKENYKEEKIDLPHTFDIYNSGTKNVNHKITKWVIRNKFHSACNSKNENYSQMIRLPLSADNIVYKYFPSKANTDNFTKIPEIYAGAWYSDKYVEYNYRKYTEDWNKWFEMIKPYMKGKISVTMQESNELEYKWKVLEFIVNDSKFNKDREDKIKELTDPNRLKEWAEEADKKEKEKQRQIAAEEEKKRKKQEEWDKWWNSLTPEQQEQQKKRWEIDRLYGYDKPSGSYVGD